MSNYLLTVDLGTSGPKVGLFTEKGKYIAHEIEPNEVILLPDGGAEQDPEHWFSTIKTALQRLLQKTGVDKDSIKAVCCTSQWSGTVPVNRDGKHIANAINWMDSRGADHVKKMMYQPIQTQGYGLFKALKWLRITGGAPGLAGKDPIAHILYIKHENPELYAKTYKFLEPVDYLTARLTGKIQATYDSICVHWVTDNRDINNITYHNGLLKTAGIDRDKLPDLVPSNSIAGKITSEAAEYLGLSTETTVVSGCGDIHSAAVGSGAVSDFQPHFYIGTSSWLVCHLPFRKIDLPHNMTTIPSAIPGKYLLANEQETSGACIHFLRDNMFFHKDDFTPDGPPDDFYEKLNTLASEVPAGSENLLFIPKLYGERSPVEDHHTRAAFFNLSLTHDRRHMIRAVMEGVALNARWLIKYVEKNAGKKFDSINLIGGGANSDLWCQITADVFNLNVRKIKNPVMANSQGAAYLAALAMGNITLKEIEEIHEIDKEFVPNLKNKAVYDKLFDEFLHFYKANKKAFIRLNKH
ncbi:MAG: FGGY-family carbohydrate kinase [Flavobacteriales bacterium]|nr:FGGY-family carbohydrate kinase [Flavobacteriales bacterium]